MKRIGLAVWAMVVLTCLIGSTQAGAQLRRTTIDAATRDALLLALNEERKAQYAYNVVIAEYGPVLPFSTIVGAEAAHVQAITTLMVRYGVPVPPNPWGVAPNLIDAPSTLYDAYLLGIAVEKEDIDLYTRLLPTVKLRDVVNVFTNLRAASVKHLAAFTAAASR